MKKTKWILTGKRTGVVAIRKPNSITIKDKNTGVQETIRTYKYVAQIIKWIKEDDTSWKKNRKTLTKIRKEKK